MSEQGKTTKYQHSQTHSLRLTGVGLTHAFLLSSWGECSLLC